MEKIFNHRCGLCIFLIACIVFISGCNSSGQDTLPHSSEVLQENSQLKSDKLPNTVEKEYVVVQDYSCNETSNLILNDFAEAINNDIAEYAPFKDDFDSFGKQLFIIKAAVTFDEGYLICGNILMKGEVYCDLYYLIDNSIIYKTSDSDMWSLNYTVFKGHTIAYGESLGWDNGKVIMQDRVNVQFANGQTVSNSFSNIPFDYNDESEEIITDGYIAIADGQTWVKNIEFYGKSGQVDDDWSSDLFKFTPPHLWKDQPNEIWTVYRYNQMLSQDGYQTLWNQNPIRVFIDGEEVNTERFLLDDLTNIEYIWRSNRNSNFNDDMKINSVSGIAFENKDDKDDVIWIALDKDNGSLEMCFDNLKLDTPPEEPGHYCLIIKHNGDSSSQQQDIYYSLFVRII